MPQKEWTFFAHTKINAKCEAVAFVHRNDPLRGSAAAGALLFDTVRSRLLLNQTINLRILHTSHIT